MTKRQKRNLLRLIVSLVLFVSGWILDGWFSFAVFLTAWLIAGYDVVINAVSGVFRRQFLDENFLMAIASTGAFFLGDYAEGAAVMIFFQIGELFQDYAVNRSRKSIGALMDMRPDIATVLKDGQAYEIDPEDVCVGDLLLVKPGERIPVDGVVVSGSAFLDTSKITGEAEPRECMEGMQVLSGCVNLSGVLTICAESVFAHSTVARILELVESASEKKAKTEQLITKFARIYTPAVVGAAVLLAVLPPLIFKDSCEMWVTRALTFLVISCPCALVISVPLSFFGGMGAASKCGIIIKGGVVLEKLAVLEQIALDKTGTLTTGDFTITEVHSSVCSAEELLQLAAAAERYSAHPAARAICNAAAYSDASADDIEELPGYGVSALVNQKRIYIGNRRLMEKIGLQMDASAVDVSCVHVAIDETYAGYIVLQDTIKQDAQAVVSTLRQKGISRIIMLTGDTTAAADYVAKSIDLDQVYASLLPQDKVALLESLMKDGGVTAFVGDGVNDAPVLSMADIGIAMGGVGSDAAVEAADAVLLQDRLQGIPDAIAIGRKTLRIAKQNICFALGVKFLILILGALGIANMWLAVFADVGVAVLAILNAMRTLRM